MIVLKGSAIVIREFRGCASEFDFLLSLKEISLIFSLW